MKKNNKQKRLFTKISSQTYVLFFFVFGFLGSAYFSKFFLSLMMSVNFITDIRLLPICLSLFSLFGSFAYIFILNFIFKKKAAQIIVYTFATNLSYWLYVLYYFRLINR